MNVIYCVLGITSNTCCIESFQDVSKKCQVLFKEKGWTGITADPSLLELANMFLDFCKKMQMKNPDSVYNDVLSVISEKSNHRFNTIKQFQSRLVYSKFMIFSRIFMTCYDNESKKFKPLISLPKTESEDIAAFIKITIKSLFDAIKRRSSLIIGKSARIKHQDIMDDHLQSLYPTYSLCKGFTNPYKVL